MKLQQKLAKLLSFFPDMELWEDEKIQECMMELYDNESMSVYDIQSFRNQRQSLCYLLKLPKVEQRSKEWFQLRENRLTASDLAQAMGKGKFGTREDLLAKKAFPISKPLEMVPPLKWGVMFEDMGMRCYQEAKNNIYIHEFGLIPHDSIDCFGASPDGITETCIMVEMKCPYRRKFNGQIPEQYYLQIQGQLATCKLEYCDYVECYIGVYDTVGEYELMVKKEDKHGIIMEYMKNNDYTYEYSPLGLSSQECIQWANETFVKNKSNTQLSFVKMTPWKLNHMFIEQVRFNKELWESCIPKIYQFWKDVLELRDKGISSIEQTPECESSKNTYTLNRLKPPKKYTFINDSDDES